MATQPAQFNEPHAKESRDCNRSSPTNSFHQSDEPITTNTKNINEADFKRSTDALIAEMSSAFDRFVSHFRDLEATVTRDNVSSTSVTGEYSSTLSSSGATNDLINANLPHEKELHLALKKAGLTWDDYLKAMRQIEEDSSFTQTQVSLNGPFPMECNNQPSSPLVHGHEHGDRSVPMQLSASQNTPSLMSAYTQPDSAPVFEGDSTFIATPRTTKERITVKSSYTRMAELQSTNGFRNEEMKNKLERQLEEARNKKWAFYRDILKSTEQWRTSSRDLEATTTMTTSRWLDVIRGSEPQRVHHDEKASNQENSEHSVTVSESLENELAHERNVIKIRMAELERFRAEEEARLKRLERMALEARLYRQTRMSARMLERRDPHRLCASELYSARSKTSNSLQERNSMPDIYKRASLPIPTYNMVNWKSEVLRDPNEECLRIKDLRMQSNWDVPVRATTVASVYNKDRELSPLEVEEVLMPDTFRRFASNESLFTRPQTADAQKIRSQVPESYQWSSHSSLKSVAVVPRSNHECLKVKDMKSKLKWAGPIRPATVTGVCNMESELRPLETEKVLTPTYRTVLQPKLIQKRSSSDSRRVDSRRSPNLGFKRLVSAKRGVSSRDSDTFTAHLPILFTKKLDKALEETVPYVPPEATYNMKMTCTSTCFNDEIGNGPETKATENPKQVKRSGPLEPHIGCETKHEQLSEVQLLPELDREVSAVHLESKLVQNVQTERPQSASVITRTEPSDLLPVSSALQNVTSLEDFETPCQQTIQCAQSRETLKTSSSNSMSSSHTIPIQINLGGNQMCPGNLPVSPSVNLKAGEVDQRHKTAIGLTNQTHQMAKQKSYQINIKLNLNQALKHFDQQRQQYLSANQLQLPEGSPTASVERTSEIDYNHEQSSRPGTRNSYQSPTPILSNQMQYMNAIQSIEVIPISNTPQNRPESSGLWCTGAGPGNGRRISSVDGIQQKTRSLDRRPVCHLDRTDTHIGQQKMELQAQRKQNITCETNLHQDTASTTGDLPKLHLSLHHALELKTDAGKFVREVAEGEIDLLESSTVHDARSFPTNFHPDPPRLSSKLNSTSQSDVCFNSVTTGNGQITKTSLSIPLEDPRDLQYTNVNKHVDACSTMCITEEQTYQLSTTHQKSIPLTSVDKPNPTVKIQVIGSGIEKNEANDQQQPPQLCFIKQPASVTHPEPRVYDKSADSLRTRTPQANKMIDEGLNIRPKSGVSKDEDQHEEKSNNPPNGSLTLTCFPSKSRIIITSPVRSFNSPHSIARDDEISRSSNRGDDTSGQIRPTQEQLCLWSTSDPINTIDTTTSAETTSSSTSHNDESSSVSLNAVDDGKTAGSSRTASAIDKNSSIALASINQSSFALSTHPSTEVCNAVNPTDDCIKQSTATAVNSSLITSNPIRQSPGVCLNATPEMRKKEDRSSQNVLVSSTDCSNFYQNDNSKSCNLFGSENVQESQMGYNNNSTIIQTNGSCSHHQLMDIAGKAPHLMSDSTGYGQDSLSETSFPSSPAKNEQILELQRNWVNAVKHFRSSIGFPHVQCPTKIIPRKRIAHNKIQTTRTNFSSFLDSAQKFAGAKCSDEQHSKVTFDGTGTQLLGLSAKHSCLRFDVNCVPGLLDNLRVVQLVRCNLTPDMLIGIDQLPQLEALNLSGNQLNYLECSHGAFPKLAILDVSDNCFEDLEHLGGPFPVLRKLNIRSNLLSAVVLNRQQELMPQLHVLDLRDNLITRTENIQLRIGFIGQVNVHGNQLRHLDKTFLLNLLATHLDLSGNLLRELPGDGLQGPILKHLDLSRNSLQSIEPLSQSWLPNLRIFRADENRIDKIPTLHCSKLSVLSLQSNRITDLSNLGTSLKSCPEICELNLTHNPCCLDKQFHFKVRQALSNLVKLNGDSTEIAGAAECSDSLPEPIACSSCLSSCCHENELYRYSTPYCSWRWPAERTQC